MKAPQLILAMALLPLTCLAQASKDSGYSSEQPRSAVAKLLEKQRAGAQQSQKEQYLDGKTRSKIYQRYVDSFGQPIPERLTGDSFSASD